MRRALSIWLPQLPLDRLVRLGDPRTDGPFAVISESKNAWRLTHLNEMACQAGVATGISLPDARAICPELLTEPRDVVRENILLRALWRWSNTLSPKVALNPPDGLLLDITGCAHLFGGEEQMADHACTRLSDMRIASRIGVADTKGAAWALARFGTGTVTVAPQGKTSEAMSNIPLAGLDISAEIINELRRTGLKSIGELYSMKSGELARRFELNLIKALTGTLGQTPDPISPAAADPVYAARMTLPEPIGYIEDVQNVLVRLAHSVCRQLQDKQRGARRFRLILRCVDTGDHELTIGFAKPCCEPGPILQQFARPLDELKIEFGADWFRLIAEQTEPQQPRQGTIGKQVQGEENTARIVSTLGNRLGFDRVRQFTAQDSHMPEREFTSVEAAGQRTALVWKRGLRKRPLRLYPRPEPLCVLQPGRPPKKFEWRRTSFEAKAASGPERLKPEWWRGGDMRTRDYWMVQTENGPRLWLLTFPGIKDHDWYVAGRFP